jgi:hypothetical protein
MRAGVPAMQNKWIDRFGMIRAAVIAGVLVLIGILYLYRH